MEFQGFVTKKNALIFKSQGTEKRKLSSQGTYNFQNLVSETLIIADNKYPKFSCLFSWI